MDEIQGLIFDIQGFSVHDGPGCRTLIFLSGCPLKCEWCANPEGALLQQRIMFSARKCRHLNTGCVRCIQACPHDAIHVNHVNEEQPLSIDRGICAGCSTHDCVEACYEEAIRLSGEWMGISSLMKTINRDRRYWGDVGGVTFSGGESFFQKDFLLAALKECKKAVIHTAVETTAFVNPAVFLDIMQYVDFAFIDLKHMDTDRHKEKTGVDNDLILKNIRALAKSWDGRLIMRMPVIENYNDDESNIGRTADFMNDLGLFEINILPFHRLGDSKWTQLGMTYQYKDVLPTPDEKMLQIQDQFLDKEIACYIGTEVLY